MELLAQAGLIGLAVFVLMGRPTSRGATCADCHEPLLRIPDVGFVHQPEGTMERWLPSGRLDHTANPILNN